MIASNGTVCKALYLVDGDPPVRFGKVYIPNLSRPADSLSPEEPGEEVRVVACSFCGTDLHWAEEALSGRARRLFPPGLSRLVLGHEAVVYDDREGRYLVPLVRGAKAPIPARREWDEPFYEHGLFNMDGFMAERAFVHRKMLVPIPDGLADEGGRLPLPLLLRLCFAEPLSCVLNAFERALDATAGNNYRIHQARGLDFERALSEARREALGRVAIFGCGVAGTLACLALPSLWEEEGIEGKAVVIDILPERARRVRFILERSPVTYLRNDGDLEKLARRALDILGGRATLFLTASGSEDEHKLAFGHDLLALNGAYVAFARTAGFTVGETINATNRIIVGATSFRKEHMERAVGMLPSWPLDELVEVVSLSELEGDPWGVLRRAVSVGRESLRSTVVWAEDLVGSAR